MIDILGFIFLVFGHLWNAIFENMFFWVVLALVAFQYNRIARSREHLFGIKGGGVFRDTAAATVYGIAGGAVGSFLLVVAGINLTGVGINYLWPLALFLMFINPRFLCFSYAGGIIALSSLVFGFPYVDIPQLMGLVAILHLVESVLIYFSGHIGATPMFTKNAAGQLIGGFTLQKFWPLPIVAIALLPDAMGYTVLPQMPGWWPLIRFDHDFSLYTVVLLPFVAGLGYGDLALAHTPAEKSRISARNLSIFSLVLLVLAYLASRLPVFGVAAALFAPLGHEAVIFLGQRMELKGTAVFVPPLRGIRVLEAVPNNAAHTAGIRSGDVLYTVNGINVNNKRELEAILWSRPELLEIQYVTFSRARWERALVRLRPNEHLGVIPVPEGDEEMYTEFRNPSLISRLIKKLWRP